MSPHPTILSSQPQHQQQHSAQRRHATKETTMIQEDNLQATRLMCFHCFDTLIHNLQQSQPQQMHQVTLQYEFSCAMQQPPPLFWKELAHTQIQCPLFVTWEKKRASAPNHTVNHFLFGGKSRFKAKSSLEAKTAEYELRGCIGSLSPLPLTTALTKYALISALQDQRFQPIHASELPQLRVAVSLLVKYEPCQHAYDWQVGVHGILIKFTKGGRQYSATYLPEVASDQGWDPPTTIQSLARKAGYHQGPVDPDLVKIIHCTRYQSSKLKMSFEEYVQLVASRQSLSQPNNNPVLYSQDTCTTSSTSNHNSVPNSLKSSPPPSENRNSRPVEGNCNVL